MAAIVQPSGIEIDRVYPLSEFKAVSGLGAHAIRMARREGLKVHYVGRVAFIAGSDFHEWLRQRDVTAKP